MWLGQFLSSLPSRNRRVTLDLLRQSCGENVLSGDLQTSTRVRTAGTVNRARHKFPLNRYILVKRTIAFLELATRLVRIENY